MFANRLLLSFFYVLFQIKIWFQNRRARERREKSITIAPPQGVTLPPTAMNSSFPPNTWIPQSNFVTPHVFFNKQRFCEPNKICEAGNKTNIPESLSSQRHNVPFSFDDRVSKVKGEPNEERPGTPLDIETVED